MQEVNDEILRVITNETKQNISYMDIVTPPIYSALFEQHAKKYDVDLDMDNISANVINESISVFQDLQEETSKNALQLSKHTARAITAIQDKDETTLNSVLEETNKLRHEIEKLKEVVYKDQLTNVFNRKWLSDNVLKKDSGCFKFGASLAIVDLNYFKQINDTYGHITGDKVLKYIAKELQSINEHIIRYGGDEFVVMFSKNTKKDTALKKLSDLRDSILKKKIRSKDDLFRISFSFGVCEFREDDSLEEILEKADQDMYKDKTSIKKKISFK